jgi:hypothetical protein
LRFDFLLLRSGVWIYGISPLGAFIDEVGDSLRLVDMGKGQPACLARGLNRNIAHSEYPLADALMHRHILHSRQHNGARGPAQKARFVPQFKIEDRNLGHAVAKMTL